jgi:hypothetical protein
MIDDALRIKINEEILERVKRSSNPFKALFHEDILKRLAILRTCPDYDFTNDIDETKI